MGARLYSPDLGRFTTTDPLRGEADRPITLNRYAYGLDNPVSNVDPTGLYVPQYGHQDRGTKTSPKRAQTASIGTSTRNVAGSTRASSKVLQLLQIKVYPKPRPAAVAMRRSSNPLTDLEAWVDRLPGFSHINNWLQEKNHPLVTPGHGDDVVGGAKALLAVGGLKVGIAAIRGGVAGISRGAASIRAGLARMAPAAPALADKARTPQARFAAGEWLRHFEKHGATNCWRGNCLGYRTSVEYLRGAQRLMAKPGVDTFVRKSGDRLFYDRVTNEFTVRTPQNIIRTYFKPDDGVAYWLRQIGGG